MADGMPAACEFCDSSSSDITSRNASVSGRRNVARPDHHSHRPTATAARYGPYWSIAATKLLKCRVAALRTAPLVAQARMSARYGWVGRRHRIRTQRAANEEPRPPVAADMRMEQNGKAQRAEARGEVGD